MTPAVYGLLVWALLLGGARSAGRSPGGGAERPGKPTPVTLTNDRPTGYFPLDPETLASAPPVLALRITRVVNPGETPFQIFVYLSCQQGAGEKGRTEPEKILMGNFGLYPADSSAGFRLRASNAFRKLKAASSNPTDVRLLLEMKRIHETRPWTPVAVVVAPPAWQTDVSK
jgi:hypothetical protein